MATKTVTVEPTQTQLSKAANILADFKLYNEFGEPLTAKQKRQIAAAVYRAMVGRKKNLVKHAARVIPDSRNAALDYFIPLDCAEALFESGELVKDVTNRAWAPAKPGTFPGKA